MAIPATWSVAWERSRGAGHDLAGKTYDVAYNAPAGTTLAAAEAAVPYGSYYTGQSGDWGARLRDVAAQPDRRTKEVLVSYHYAPPTVEEALLLDTNKVLVETRSSNFAYYPVTDWNGDNVWRAMREDDAGSVKWEITKGAGVKFEERILFRTRFARDYGMGANLLSYQNTVLGAYYQQYWMVPTGSLRFAAFTDYRAPTVEKLRVYDCLMEYVPGGWNEETEIQKYVYRVYQIERLDADGASLSPKKYDPVGDWYPTGNPYYAEFYPAKQWPLVLGQYDW